MPSHVPTVEELAAAVARLEERIARLEHGSPSAPVVAPLAAAPVAPAPPPSAAPKGRDVQADLALLGRSAMVVGLGYLLRALTDLPTVPDGLGVAVGAGLALSLLFLAFRAGARGAVASSTWHGVTALVVGYPLLYESIVRFALLPPAAGALGVAAFGAAALAVAYAHRVSPLAWITVAATLAAAIALGFETRMLVPYAWVVAAWVGGAAILGRRLEERFLVWPAAIAADLVVLAAMLVVLSDPAAPGAMSAPLLGLAFTLGAAGVMRAGRFTPFGAAQACLAVAVGAGGGAWAAVRLGGGLPFAAGAAVVGVAGTVLALRGAERTAFWTSLWFVGAQVPVLMAVSGAPLAALELAVAVALLLVARRRAHPLAELHAALALGVAAAGGGLVSLALRGLVGSPSGLPAAGIVPLVTLATVAVAAIAGVREPPAGAWAGRAAKLTALALLGFCVTGVLAWAILSGVEVPRAVAAAIRTGLLALAAVALAAVSRVECVRSAGLIVYGVLAAAGVKLVVEDFVVGTAATEFAALALFGAALIVAPRLRAASLGRRVP